MSNRLRDFLRDLFKAIAVYAAGAWVAIEVVEFAVRQYGLTPFLVNAAVVVAFGGGMVTAVLVWFHGESGRQKAPPSEIVIIGSIAVATGIALFYLSNIDPLDQFENLAGYRLVVEYRERDPESVEISTFSYAPMDSIYPIEGGQHGIFSLGAGGGELSGPIMNGHFEGIPVMFFDPTDSDYLQITFVLPHEPTDVRDLFELGLEHKKAKIVTDGLSLEIDSRITLTEQDDGSIIRIDW